MTRWGPLVVAQGVRATFTRGAVRVRLTSDRPVAAALALSAFRRDEPRARAVLADPAVAALLAALRQKVHDHLPYEPLLGDAHDLHW